MWVMGGRKADGLQMVQAVVVATTRQQENEDAGVIFSLI
jgi:hypothetical protein